MDYNELKHIVSKEEILKWLEMDEKRVEVERRTGKTERLLDIAIDKLKNNKVIALRPSVCEYGSPNNFPSFVDNNPKNFIKRFRDKIRENNMLVKSHNYTFYFIDSNILNDFEKEFFKRYPPKDFIDAFELRNSSLYLHEYGSYIGKKDPNTYVENGVDFKCSCMDYIKIIK